MSEPASDKMRFLVVFAHPRPDSFGAALRHAAVEALAGAGHQVDLLDLYATRFDPVLSAEEHAAYYDLGRNRAGIEDHIARLERAQGLVLLYPTWWFGFPAMLKGYFDRVWVPGAAFEMGRFAPRRKLQNIVKFAAITTHGSPWWYVRVYLRDPTYRLLQRGFAALFHPGCKTLYLELYGMDRTSDQRRRRFIERVRRDLARF